VRRAAVSLLCLLILANLLLRPAAPEVIRQTLAPGVEFTQEIVPPPDGPLVWNVLRVNLKERGVKVQAALGRDVVLTDEPAKGRETVGDMAARHGALAAVNADFFPFTGAPVGLMIRDGELLRESMPQRAAMGITADGQVLMDNLLPVGTLFASDGMPVALDGINRPAAKDEIVALTPAFGAKTRADVKTTVVPLVNVNLPARAGQEQAGVAGQAAPGDPNGAILAGGAALVGDGKGGEWLKAHVKVGDTVRFRFDFVPNALPPGPPRSSLTARAGALRGRIGRSAWTDVTQAVGGGPWLVRDGKVALDGVEEGFSRKEFVEQRHPRTAAGVTASGELLLVTVDGRQAFSRGVSLSELAQYMLRLGAVRAINLDGGGSTTMVVRGLYVNGPSDGEPRAVADALLVFGEALTPRPSSTPPVPPSQGGDSRIAPPLEGGDRGGKVQENGVTLRAGERVTLALTPDPLHGIVGSPSPTLPATPNNGEREKDMPVLWGTAAGRGFVNQRGVFTTTRASSGTVVVLTSAGVARVPFTAMPGPPARLKAAFSPSPNNPPDRNILTITVTDAYGNPLAGQAVRISAGGGTPERGSALTEADGRAVVEVVWDVEKNRRAEVSCGGLAPVTVRAKTPAPDR
jgi:hypothetical protein